MTSERTMIGTPPKKMPTHAIIYEGKAETANSLEEAKRLAQSQAMAGKRTFVALFLSEFKPSVEVRELVTTSTEHPPQQDDPTLPQAIKIEEDGR